MVLKRRRRPSGLGGELCFMTLAILAGFGVRRLLATTSSFRARAILVGLVAAVTLDLRPVLPLQRVWPEPPPIYGSLAGASDVVLAEFPMGGDARAWVTDTAHMYFSLWHWSSLVNGYSGHLARGYTEFQEEMKRFPDSRTLDLLKARGVTHGVWFVDLAPLSDPELLPNVIARVLELPEGSRASFRDALVEWLRPRHVLLILDNCEHLIDACAALAETLLRKASQLRILSTSREGLGVQGETVWPVPSLAVPQHAQRLQLEEVLEFDGVRLFVDRAVAVAPFLLTPANANTVTEICRRLDGIPLAIELAAARVKILSVEQINARLQDRFRLLTGGARTAVARQRTLEATVDWSYELLSDAERRLLARLTVFSGGWTLEAAEHVCSDDGIDQSEVLDLLSHLVDKSLVVVEESASGERRYRLLETIRQYGRDRLFRSGEAVAVGARHFECFLALARRAKPELVRGDQVTCRNCRTTRIRTRCRSPPA